MSNNPQPTQATGASASAPSAAAAAAAPLATAAPVVASSVTDDPTDKAVLEYLRKKGMGTAAVELTQILQSKGTYADKSGATATDKDDASGVMGSKDQLDDEDKKGILAKATGGGYGYDRDAAAPVVQWGIPDKTATKASPNEGLADRMGVDEARCLLDSFTSFQLWVLSLPDHDGLQKTANPLLKAQKLIRSGKPGVSLASVVQSLTPSNLEKDAARSSEAVEGDGCIFQLPPSAKPELLAVAFALLVHTYCELLEVGMESTAHVLRDTFKSVYEPLYSKEFTDLYQCNTTEDMMRLNSHNAQHMEALANLKAILVQVASYQLKRDEFSKASSSNMDAATLAAKQAKVQEYDRTIGMLQQKCNELSQRASMAFHKMHDLPFLRRARAVRWQLSMSTATYGLLAAFLNADDTSLLAMSTLLQTKCELHVERRDPLPFTPACVLDDNMEKNGEVTLEINKQYINWAAPMPRQQIELSNGEKLPFPKFHLDEEYDDEGKAKEDQKLVEFNRSLLVNGFRRLEALERKQEYENLPRLKLAKEDYHHHASSRKPPILWSRPFYCRLCVPMLSTPPADPFLYLARIPFRLRPVSGKSRALVYVVPRFVRPMVVKSRSVATMPLCASGI